MNRNQLAIRVIPWCLPVLLLLATAIPASAETVLRFSPQDGTVNINDTASLSVFVDEPLELRTFEAFVHYDDDILTSVNGVHGQLFTDTGAYIFESWEETSPGYWHGYAIVMDALSWVVGPGELYVWTFTADQGGLCPVTVDSLALYEPEANIIPDAVLTPTTVRVFDPASTSIPGLGAIPITLFPNPFNPGASLTLNVDHEGPGIVEVYDCRGRLVNTAWSGLLKGQPLQFTWDGRDRNGASLASGVYLFRLEGSRGARGMVRGMLVK